MSTTSERLKELFEGVLETDVKYEGPIEDLDYYNLFCKAASSGQLFRSMGNDLCLFNCIFENSDAVLMIFYIPLKPEEYGAKGIAERVMEITRETEKAFITIDHLNSFELKGEKFVYVTAIKKIE